MEHGGNDASCLASMSQIHFPSAQAADANHFDCDTACHGGGFDANGICLPVCHGFQNQLTNQGQNDAQVLDTMQQFPFPNNQQPGANHFDCDVACYGAPDTGGASVDHEC